MLTALSVAASFFCCGWSAFTYLLWGMPNDKKDRSYFANAWGFRDPVPALIEAWALLKSDWSFHHLKNLLVEHCRADAQRAAKLYAMWGCWLGLAGLLIGGGIGWAL